MNIDFGRYYLALPSANISISFYSRRSKEQPPVWEFNIGSFQYQRSSYVLKAWLTNLIDHSSQEAFDHLIEVDRADEYALPILWYTPDSPWIQVSLDCRILHNPPTAWLYLYDALALNAEIKSWLQFFVTDQSVVFMNDSAIVFYDDSTAQHRVFPKLAGDSIKPDYSMRIIGPSGSMMQVYLYTPSDFPAFEDPNEARLNSKNPPQKFWIRYVDKQGRPQIWYLSE